MRGASASHNKQTKKKKKKRNNTNEKCKIMLSKNNHIIHQPPITSDIQNTSDKIEFLYNSTTITPASSLSTCLQTCTAFPKTIGNTNNKQKHNYMIAVGLMSARRSSTQVTVSCSFCNLRMESDKGIQKTTTKKQKEKMDGEINQWGKYCC